METLKKYWWLVLILPVVAYLFYITMKQNNGKPKPGSPEYARMKKAEKALLSQAEMEEIEEEETTLENGRNSTEVKTA